MSKKEIKSKKNNASANLKFVRVSPYKLRKVADQVRKLTVTDAEMRLSLMPQKSASILNKLLKSCIANATHNFSLDKNNLFIDYLVVNEGPKYKRSMARARGRMFRIIHPTSHIKIIISSKGEINGPKG